MAKRMKGKTLSLPVGIGIGIAVSMALTVGGAMLLAVLINGEQMGFASLSTAISLIHLIASFAGTYLATALTQQKKLITASATAAGYLIVLLGMTALLFGGQYEGVWLSLLMVLLGAGCVILLDLRGSKSPARKHKIPVYR